MVLKFIRSLSDIGIDQSHDVFDKATIRTANNFFLLSVPVYLVFIFINLFKQSFPHVIAFTILLVLATVTLVLNYNKKHKAASYYVIYSFLFQFSFLYIIFGPKMGIEPLYILLVLASIYLFYRTKQVYIIVISIVLMYLIVRFVAPMYLDSHFSVLPITPYVFFITAVIIISQFAIIRFREIVTYADSRNQAVQKLQVINQSLIENEKLILNQKNELEVINDQLERYAFVASHDLKSPIRSIKSFLDLSRIKLKQGDTEKVEEYFSFMSKSATHMSNLVNDLLEFSKLENQKILFEKTNLNTILATAIELLQVEKSVVSDHLPHSIVNPVQFQIIFQNLIQNGLKYNESDRPMVEIKYLLKDDTHVLTFTDNGLGIEAKYKDEIFQMFARLHTSNKYEGTGLGLSICHKIMIQHKGKIILKESTYGEGSTFEMSWPVDLKSISFQEE